MNRSADAVIIGGGVAGLTAAAYIAKSGIKTILLESNDHVGGYMGSFDRGGISFDYGIRALENSGVILPLLKDLGIEDEVTFLENRVGQHIVDTLYPITNIEESKLYFDGLVKQFPHQKEALEVVKNLMVDSIKDTQNLYGGDNPLFAKGLKKIVLNIKFLAQNYALMRKLSDPESISRVPIEQVLSEYISDPTLLAVLTKAFFDNSPSYFVLSYHRLFFDYMYPKGGMKMFPLALEKVINRYKGDVYTSTRVERITGTGPFNVVLEDKSIVKAKRVILACDPSSFSEITNITRGDSKPGESVFTLFLGVDIPPKEIAPHSIGHLFHISEIGSTLEESRNATLRDFGLLSNLEISIPAVRDPSLAPEGQTGLIISAPMFATTKDYDWLNCSNEESEKMKEVVIDGLLESVSSLIPQLKDRSHIIYQSSVTPKDYQNMTQNSGGSITGWGYINEKAPSEISFFLMNKAVNTAVDGVYKCGQWTFSPTGAPVSIMTGKLASQALIRSLKK
jgi:phytoene dehydrogenase-like protein